MVQGANADVQAFEIDTGNIDAQSENNGQKSAALAEVPPSLTERDAKEDNSSKKSNHEAIEDNANPEEVGEAAEEEDPAI